MKHHVKSKLLVEFSYQLINFCFQLRKLPRLIFLLQFFTSSDHAQQMTQINSLLSSRQSAFSGLYLHIIEVN